MAKKIIRFIFLSITLVLLSVSVYYSRSWHLFVQMPPWIAWGLSGAFVASATALFDLAIGKFLEFRKSYFNILVGSFFLFVWLILTSYSMYSTLAGQFNKMLKSDVDVYQVSEMDNEIQILERKLERLKNPPVVDSESKRILLDDIDNETTELLSEKGIINKMISDTSGAAEAAEFRSAIRDAYSRLEKIEKELTRLSADKKILLLPVSIPDTTELENEIRDLKNNRNTNLTDDEKIALQEDIFDFLADIFSVDNNLIQFIALAFPSILVDLISPIFSALFIYGVSSKRKDKPDLGYLQGKTYDEGKADAFNAVNDELRRRLHDNHK